MKRTLLISILMLLAFGSYAQLHLGLSTAGNSTFVLDKGLTEDPRYNSTMTYDFAPIGFTMGLNLTKSFGLQLESILSNQGQIYEVIDIANNVVGQREIDLSYIQIPLLFKFMSGSNNIARPTFSLGPQLSLLTEGYESLQYMQSVMEVPEDLATANGDGTYTIVDPSTSQVLTDQATMNPDGTYNMPEFNSTELLSSNALNEFQQLRDAEFQIAASFGLDVDLGKHIYLSSIIRANYSLTDMRNGDVVELIRTEGVNSIFNKRANLLVGVQLGLNYVIGGTRSFNKKNPSSAK
ncbi:MAG: outer membrane beta-barrel protein [Candidatus Cyclobacteriaceae bacterium M2_1C_046]